MDVEAIAIIFKVEAVIGANMEKLTTGALLLYFKQLILKLLFSFSYPKNLQRAEKATYPKLHSRKNIYSPPIVSMAVLIDFTSREK